MGFADLEVCIYCRAVLAPESPRAGRTLRRRPAGESSPLVKLIWFYIALLAVSIIYGATDQFGFKPGLVFNRETMIGWLTRTSIVEAIDAGLVILALVWVGRPAPLPSQTLVLRTATWSVAAPVLLLLLGVNYAYHRFLIEYLKIPVAAPDFFAHKDLIPWVILVICVQPAVVEELLCRYLALGVLRQVTGTHGAVLVSAVMFGMLHIFAPISIPVLTLIGVAFGYIRVASGSLILPMLMHFGHNLAVLFIQ
jgi:membrane protease YdiL (CAAX protease family)